MNIEKLLDIDPELPAAHLFRNVVALDWRGEKWSVAANRHLLMAHKTERADALPLEAISSMPNADGVVKMLETSCLANLRLVSANDLRDWCDPADWMHECATCDGKGHDGGNISEGKALFSARPCNACDGDGFCFPAARPALVFGNKIDRNFLAQVLEVASHETTVRIGFVKHYTVLEGDNWIALIASMMSGVGDDILPCYDIEISTQKAVAKVVL